MFVKSQTQKGHDSGWGSGPAARYICVSIYIEIYLFTTNISAWIQIHLIANFHNNNKKKLVTNKSYLLLLTTYIYGSIPSSHNGGYSWLQKQKPEDRDPKLLKTKFLFEKTIKHILFLGFHPRLINTSEAEKQKKQLPKKQLPWKWVRDSLCRLNDFERRFPCELL